jgi:hypothetical protein
MFHYYSNESRNCGELYSVNLSWFEDNITEAERKAMGDCVAWPERTCDPIDKNATSSF